MSEIYEEVLATEVYKAYEAAQKDLGRLIDKVNSVIMGQVSGNVEGCTHDCSSAAAAMRDRRLVLRNFRERNRQNYGTSP